jgi:hypothetical protein
MNLLRWWRPDPEVKAFVADLNTVAFSSYTNQRLWLRTGHAILAAIIWALLTDNAARLMSILEFVLMWCGFLTGKSLVTAGRDAVKRNTDIDFVREKALGKVSGPPTVTAHAEDQGTVTVETGAAKTPSSAVGGEEPKWAEGDPRAGIL